MVRTARRTALALLIVGLSVLPAAAAARGPRTVNARVSGTFTMNGRVTTAVRVRGEHRGQRVTRRWVFASQRCTRDVCRRLVLTRERSAGQYDHLVLRRVGRGRYAGGGRFYVGLECNGAIFPRGELVPFRITVDVMRATRIDGRAFATSLRATYSNRRRIDRTICPVGPSHDAARYGGRATPPPSAPTAAFTVATSPGSDTATFNDTSAPGGDGARIVSVAWQFGDPASGAADTATTPQASHAFSAPGTYSVSLTVTDTAGLRTTTTQQVTVPPPPPPAPASAGG